MLQSLAARQASLFDAESPLEVDLDVAAGLTYCGPPLPLGFSRWLYCGDIIQPWQAQWLETMGYTSVKVAR